MVVIIKDRTPGRVCRKVKEREGRELTYDVVYDKLMR